MIEVFIETSVFISACIQHTFSDTGVEGIKEVSHKWYSGCKHAINLISEMNIGVTSDTVITEANSTLSKAITSTILEHEAKHGTIDRELQIGIAGELLRSARLKKDEYSRILKVVKISDDTLWQKIRYEVESFYRELRPNPRKAKRESEKFAATVPGRFKKIAKGIRYKEAMDASYSHLPSFTDKNILADSIYYRKSMPKDEKSAELYFATEDGNFVNLNYLSFS